MSETAPSLENLRPALAGLIVDNEVGRKEAYATFINLVERGYIENANFAKRDFQMGKKGLEGLRGFEKYLLAEYVSKFAVKCDENSLHQFLKNIGASSAFGEEVIKAAEEDMIYERYAHLGFLGVLSKKIEEILKAKTDASHFLIFRIAVLILLLPVLAFFIITGKNELNETICAMALFILLAVGGAMFYFWVRNRQIKMDYKESGALDESMTLKGEKLRTKYLELLQWLKAHPLKEYRWGNEFLPYAVAFGLYKEYEKFPK